ncbi:hypothetical protein SUNI508_04807 [Seiridium unicorne]|uniref:Carrier domain-containing protein n=1 Tax=Seiridium unicorne TaxID=138068 RepID=A0ABR2V6Q9_9PEZI
MAHLTSKYIEQIYESFGDLKVLDDIIQHRAKDNPPASILGYPSSDDSPDKYEKFTGKDLDVFIDAAAKYYLEAGLKPNTREVIGIFAASNVDFVVTFFALSRLGYTVLCLSLRLAHVAITNLLKQTNCGTIAHGNTQQIGATIASVGVEVALKSVALPDRTIYGVSRPDTESRFVREFDRDSETKEIALIMHSSGSTGLPKPVFLSHQNVLTHAVQGTGLDNFGALPLYHMYGISTTLQAMYMAKTASLISATLPMTAENLVAAMDAIRPEVIHAVPYALGLVVEHERGLECLKNAKIVTAAGARTPDQLGDYLVQKGVNFGVVFGTTEAGLLGDTMRREEGDRTWNYVRIYSNIRNSICMDPIGDGQYEAVYLKSHPGLCTSNSDNPAPGSWRSKDVFIPHPTITDVWKYVTRLDDRVTLSNGEKVLPLPIEGRVRQVDVVREAVVVGVDRPVPGLILFRDKTADDIADEDLIEKAWVAIADANAGAETFSQIMREMITVLPSDVDYPKTDKGSIIRGQIYRKFEETIRKMYEKLEGGAQGALRPDLAGIESFLKHAYQDIVGVTLEADVDFFTAGIDSLKAIQMRHVIQQHLDLGGNELSINVVYEQGNIKNLSTYLLSLREGSGNVHMDETPLMKDLITKYSHFGDSVILTGATGSLGAHILAQLVERSEIRKVYCLGRGENLRARVFQSLEWRGLKLRDSDKSKVVALSANLDQEDLGLEDGQLELFKSEVSLIIHLAWPVNFNIQLQSFEAHLAGLNKLLTLSQAVYRSEPARIFFASSISTAENTTAPAVIPNAPIQDFKQASDMGYAQSKLVGEHMVLNAARKGARSYILRIGQIVGDRRNGVWNDNEFIPSMIRSALSMKTLPDLHEQCSWLPVDTLATAILELDHTLQVAPRPCMVDPFSPPIVYNMVNPHVFSWGQLLDQLHSSGLDFKAVPTEEWLRRLRESASHVGEEKTNPAVKLVDHFEQRYLTSNGATTDDPSTDGITFDTKAVQRDTEILREPPDVIQDGHVNKFISTWLEQWTKT